jgi:tRNA pseudouridine38-40 synthase
VRGVRLRLDLAYDGEPFAGFARQPDQRTVQGDVEAVLADLFGVTGRTVAAGRTDRGVHADAQVLHVDVPGDALAVNGLAAVSAAGPSGAPVATELARALDLATDGAVRLLALRVVTERFDARFGATSRAYRFRLRDGVDPRASGPSGPMLDARGPARDPAEAPDVWGLVARLDVAAMRRGAQHLVGEHDFAAFCRATPGRTTMRRIDLLTVRRLGAAPGRIDIRVIGRAFCHQQVRSIVGCLVDVGSGRRPADWIGEVLAGRDRSRAAPVAPPRGLTLERVTYGPGVHASPPRSGREAPPRRRGLADPA